VEVERRKNMRGLDMKEARRDGYYLYVGTYTMDPRAGLHVYRLDAASGDLQSVGMASGSDNPSYLVVHPNERYLYAVNEVGDFDDAGSGAISAYAVNPIDGQLSLINKASSQGSGPCYVSLDGRGRYALLANYSGGSVAVLRLQDDGSLGEATDSTHHRGKSVHPQRQEAPHPHCIVLDPDDGYALVPDLGLDRIVIYRFDTAKGEITGCPTAVTKAKPGAGPRHLVFHPSGRFVYVINELNSSITAYSYQSQKGILTELETVPTIPPDFHGTNTGADIHVHPSGRFLYGSNRGHDSLVIFRIHEHTGKLTYLGHQATLGKTPRNFTISPCGRFLLVANQDSGTIVLFKLDGETGELTPGDVIVEVPRPVCIKMMPRS